MTFSTASHTENIAWENSGTIHKPGIRTGFFPLVLTVFFYVKIHLKDLFKIF